MNEKTFTYKGITIMVRMAIGWDATDKRVIYGKLAQAGLLKAGDDLDNSRAVFFAQAIVQTVKADGLGFEMPAANASAVALSQAYHEIGKLPDTVLMQWINALDEADTPPTVQSDLNPDTDPNAETNPVSQESAAD